VQWYNNINIVIIIIIYMVLLELILELDDCCYSYVSPNIVLNDTFCVPNGEQVTLTYGIFNPHDNLTNLTVTWFRSITEDTSIFEEISASSEDYIFRKFVSGIAYNLSSVINCSHELYIEIISLTILHFTRNKTGYYWCQLSINNTLAQPSYRAHFSVGECNNNITRLTILSEIQCAQYVATESDAGLTTTYVSSATSSNASSRESSTISSSATQQERESKKPISYVATESDAELSTRFSSVTQHERESDLPITYIATESTISPPVTQQEKESLSDKSIIYVAGSLGALLLIALLGVLALAFSFASYVHHQRKKPSKLHGST
jgi:hypothetical protein